VEIFSRLHNGIGVPNCRKSPLMVVYLLHPMEVLLLLAMAGALRGLAVVLVGVLVSC
jgi:hypothetical protein